MTPVRGAPDGRAAAPLAELWMPTADPGSRDLLHGPGGRRLAPRQGAAFEFRKLDTDGFSRGVDVVDSQRRKWDVKLGPEAQPEVVLSRVLWAIGYHQPITYFLPEWRLTGGPEGEAVGSGRFRLESDHESEGDWAWHDNPFVGTAAFKSLVVINVLLANWDFKQVNNRVYRVATPGRAPSRRFVVQDLGASLGRSRRIVPGTRNDIDGFEAQRFIKAVEDGRVVFDFHGKAPDLLQDLTPADVAAACRLLERLDARQWTDAFRAAAYAPAITDRYIRRIRAKIAEGLALDPTGGAL